MTSSVITQLFRDISKVIQGHRPCCQSKAHYATSY